MSGPRGPWMKTPGSMADECKNRLFSTAIRSESTNEEQLG